MSDKIFHRTENIMKQTNITFTHSLKNSKKLMYNMSIYVTAKNNTLRDTQNGLTELR